MQQWDLDTDRWVLELSTPEIELEVFWGDGQERPTLAFWLLSQDGVPLTWMVAGEG